jgi:hypothetical protein
MGLVTGGVERENSKFKAIAFRVIHAGRKMQGKLHWALRFRFLYRMSKTDRLPAMADNQIGTL